MNIHPIQTTIFKEGEDLASFVTRHIPHLKENSVLIITSKIVALSEERTVQDASEKNRERLIKRESSFSIETKYPRVWLTIRDGMFMASAGIDESNANGKLILLPKDSFLSARMLRRKLKAYYKIKNLGILITDSRTLPLRTGVVGVALGYAGFRGVKDYRGTKDIFNRRFKFSRVDVADSLATAGVLTMGEGAECRPLCIATDTEITFCEKVKRKELHIAPEDDMYHPLFNNLFRK